MAAGAFNFNNSNEIVVTPQARQNKPKRKKVKRGIFSRPRINKYILSGKGANVAGTYVRNPKQAAQINQMHEKQLQRIKERADV